MKRRCHDIVQAETGILLVDHVYCSCTVVTSQPDTVDMTVTFLSSHRRLELKSDPRENNSHPCAQRTLHLFCVVSTLGAGFPVIGILISS